MDGLAEKANDSVQTFLWAYASQNVDEWDNLLTLVEFTYNVATHKATRVSPIKADIGYIPRLPLDFLMDPS